MRMREACGGEVKPGRQLSGPDTRLSGPMGYQRRHDSTRRGRGERKEGTAARTTNIEREGER